MVKSYSCYCLNNETSTQCNRGYTTETPSISYNMYLYIRLVATLYFTSLIIDENNFYWTWSPVRCGSHQGGSLQNILGDERTCRTTLALAYVLRCLSAAWSQLQMKKRSPSGSECWMVCHRWTLEIEFNKRLSSSIIRLVNYNVTTSLIYNWYYRRCLGFQW